MGKPSIRLRLDTLLQRPPAGNQLRNGRGLRRVLHGDALKLGNLVAEQPQLALGIDERPRRRLVTGRCVPGQYQALICFIARHGGRLARLWCGVNGRLG